MSKPNDHTALSGRDLAGRDPLQVSEASLRVVGGLAPKRPYSRPSLVRYGKLQDVTLGGTPGNTDSGSGGTRKR